MESNSEINNFVIRFGELHVVFTDFKMLGKIIDGSGSDKAFEEALIYGSNTIEQIKDGHHLCRCFEGHQILCLSLLKKIYTVINRLSPINRKGLKGGYHQCYYNYWKSEAGAQWKFQRNY